MPTQPPLKPLHSDALLLSEKIRKYEALSTELMVETLKPGQEQALRTRPDGTILNGHHRIKVLRARGVDVDALPREVIEYSSLNDGEPKA